MKTALKTLLVCMLAFLGQALRAQMAVYASFKEKVYVHTNHVFFKPGETVYFKVYVVNASDQRPTKLSSVVYTDVINPSGNVLDKLTLKVENGYAEGSYTFNEQTVGGIYKLKAYTTWMRNEKDSTFFVKELTVQKLIAPRILMKLDFPEKGYGPGDEVKADFSMRSLSDQPIKNHKGKFVVALNGIATRTGEFTTGSDGKAVVRFGLPHNLQTTDGLLTITIAYDAYTESISRSIPIVLHRVDLQFMPEGGVMVEGIPSVIAFKAINEHGKAADIKGEVWDDMGNRVASFESFHFGMGKFLLRPQKGRKYTARIIAPANIKQEYYLPAAATSGVVINLTKTNNKIRTKLLASEERIVKVVAQSRNTVYYHKTVLLRKGENIVDLDEKIFPTGVAQFTLYTANDLPLAERLIFLNEHRRLQVSLQTNKGKYLPREKVTLTITTSDENGKPIPSNISLSVVDDKLWTMADDKQDHIMSWLLMSSELKGKVEEPQFYFKKDEEKASPALDLVMLTHGYRYFDYIEYVRKEDKLQYLPDQANVLNGLVVDANGKPVKATLFLVHAVHQGKAIRTTTADDGSFFFSDLSPNASYYLFAQSASKKEKVSIKILQNGIGYNLTGQRKYTIVPSRPIEEFAQLHHLPAPDMKLVAVNNKMDRNAVPLPQHRNANLDEVVVVGYAAQNRKLLTGAVAVIHQQDMLINNHPGQLLQGRLAGVAIVREANPQGDQRIEIRGVRSLSDTHQPLVVINGVPVEKFSLSTIAPADIESITVIKDASAVAIYGPRAAYGVIAIESKKSFYHERIKVRLSKSYAYASQFIQTTGPVYSVVKRFYAPKYHSVETEERNDFRETIYWNPVIQTNKEGRAEVEFYNSDATTTFRIIAEGISYHGMAGRTEKTYSAQSPMSVDAKIPPYLTVGDKSLIPVVIKNNMDESLDISIEVRLPEQINIGSFTNSIVILPDSSKQILVPIEAVKAVSGNIQLVVHSQFKKEILSLPVEATDKGFPVIETFSGNKSTEHHFHINQMVQGSLKASLKLYKNIEGQLLDGIESMLREPYGCFEQTSSTTYPNVFVLKYLRQSGKSNKEIEKKALAYIREGYNRLISFETAEDGFEWFGKTPAHEALTAYGLLEFTDMKEFIHVDEKMLSRTKNFLLDRRDGQGGFKLATGGYDRFASVPNKIANLYIVYALTQAGLGKEIELEYATAVKKALASNDGYQLSLMALAASNMKRQQDYQTLMQALHHLYQQSGLPAETSVVNSRETSLKVETLSLYALALMRHPSPNVATIAKIISEILAKKCYYGYGSTQATVLALQALVEYKKLAGKLNENNQIAFLVNRSSIRENDSITSYLKEGQNVFSIHYRDEKNAIPYSLEIAYNTLTPPNSDKADIKLSTKLAAKEATVGETVRLQVEVSNSTSKLQPMTVAKVGIPAGLATQPWQLKELMEQNKVAYYEIFDRYLVFYWMGFAPNETKMIHLDLKAEVPGMYKGKASNTYLYYTPEHKNWNDGLEIEIK